MKAIFSKWFRSASLIVVSAWFGGSVVAAPARATVSLPKFEGDQIRFDWDTGGDLQLAPTPSGPWTTVAAPQNKASTVRLPSSQRGAVFFRVVDEGRPGEPKPIIGGDPAKPFRVAKAFIRLADRGNEGNVLVEMELEPDQSPPPQIPLLFGPSPLVFRDDGGGGDAQAGDGVFTAATFFDVQSLEASNRFRESILQGFGVVGAFDQRTVINARPTAPYDVESFRRGERLLVHPSPFHTGLSNNVAVAPAGGPGRRGASPAALAGSTGLLTKVCFTNVQFQELILTNLVATPEVTVTKSLIGTIPHPITSNVVEVVVVKDPNPLVILTNELVETVVKGTCEIVTTQVVTNVVTKPGGFPAGDSFSRLTTNVVVTLVPCLITNTVVQPVTLTLPPGLRTNLVTRTVVIGTNNEAVFGEVFTTNIVFKPLLIFTNLAMTNVVCTNLALGGGTNVNITNIQALLDRPVFWDKSLLITDLSVVEDPRRTFDPCTGRGTKMGAWTFGRLMADMANQPVTGLNPSDFARRWLRSWQTDQVINFDLVHQRNPEIIAQVLADWEAASGGPSQPLDLSIAPFRLLAIVNRLDLRLNPGYGDVSPDDPCNPACLGGEGRFVFGLIRDAFKGGGGQPPAPGYGGGGGGGLNPCDPAQFTVIFEYCIPRRNCAQIQEFAAQWYALSGIRFGEIFNEALQQITDQFAGRGADPARKPNQSALNQLRANELLREPWELREWKLFATDSDAGHLREVTVKQTPDFDHNFQPIMTEFCLANAADILAGRHTVPLMWRSPGQAQVPFLGGVGPVPTKDFFWDGPPPAASSIPNEVRHRFSLNTCNGCHAGETRTAFTHVAPRPVGVPATLSDFLTGLNMPKLDPADNATPRFFADLKRREDDLIQLLFEPCPFQVFRDPVRFKH